MLLDLIDRRYNTVVTLGILGMVLTGEFKKFDFVELHMGVEVQLTYYCESVAKAEEAGRAVYARIADLEQKMSDYRPTSEVRQLQESAVGKWVSVSSDLLKVLSFGQKISKESQGAFDMTAGPFVALWRESRKTQRSPSYPDLQRAREVVGWEKIEIDQRAREVRIAQSGVKIDLGGIAKGYACDEAIRVFEKYGIRSASIVAGGDLKVSNPPPKTYGWPIRVTNSDQVLYLKNVAVSTSGDTEQFVELHGVRYSHIVDPRNGFGVMNRIQATVIAKNGLTSDPMATALCVLGKPGEKMLAKFGAKSSFISGR